MADTEGRRELEIEQRPAPQAAPRRVEPAGPERNNWDPFEPEPDSGPDHPERGDVWLAWALVLSLMLFHVCANLWWLAEDNHVIRTDEEGHMLLAREYYSALFIEDFAHPLKRLEAVGDIEPGNPAHPPLLQKAGALMVRAFAYSPDTLAATNTVMFVLVILGVFLIARRFLYPLPAFFATMVVSFTPIVYGASRFFMTDFLSLTIVVWAIYALLRSQCFLRTHWVFFFALLNGLGILARPTTFLYYLVPCAFVVLAGLWAVAARRVEGLRFWPGIGRLTLNCIMTLVVSVGVFFPWYFHHIDRFYEFWFTQHAGGGGGPLALQLWNGSDGAAAVSAVHAYASMLPALTTLEVWLDRLANPELPWSRYPLYAINNGAFLPLFILGVIGIFPALFQKRFRSFSAVVLVLWLIGAWVLMTLLFKYATARYTLPAIVPLAMFGAVAVLSPPWKVLRAILGALLTALLLYTYGNLTVHPYGQMARAVVPAPIDPFVVKEYGDEGLVVWKDTLSLGFSYANMAPPTQANYKDRLFAAMAREESQTSAGGEYANFLRLRMRGMELEQEHYWPEPHPFHLPLLSIEDQPRRKLRSIGMGNEPEDLLGQLERADYVVYAIEDDQEQKEAQWHAWFKDRGLELVARFHAEGFGGVPDRNYGVFAQRGAAIELETQEDIDQLDLLKLHQVLGWEQFEMLPPELQEHARDRFERLLAERGPSFLISREAEVIPLTLQRVAERRYQFLIFFHVLEEMDRDYRMFLLAYPQPGDIARLPEDRQEEGFLQFLLPLDPETSTWEEGEYVLVSQVVELPPMPMRFAFGLADVEGDPHGRAANLPWIKLGELPVAGATGELPAAEGEAPGAEAVRAQQSVDRMLEEAPEAAPPGAPADQPAPVPEETAAPDLPDLPFDAIEEPEAPQEPAPRGMPGGDEAEEESALTPETEAVNGEEAGTADTVEGIEAAPPGNGGTTAFE